MNNRMNILFISPFIPYPLEEGGNPRTFEMLKALSEAHNVYLVSFMENPDEERHLFLLRQWCKAVEVIPKKIHLRRYKFLFPLAVLGSLFSKEPYLIYKFRSRKMLAKVRELSKGRRFDAVYIDQLNMNQFVEKGRAGFKILSEHNVEYLSLKRYSDTASNIFKSLYAAIDCLKLKRYEAKACSEADMVLAVSEDDERALSSLTSGKPARVSVVHYAIQPEYWKPSGEEYDKDTISFVGRMDYAPNVDGIKWFHKNVFPAVKRGSPNARLVLIGSSPSREIQRLSENKDIIVTGYVDDVRPYLAKSILSVVPLLYGGGVKTKTLAALSMGVPVVSTSVGCEGIKAINGKDALITDEPDLFAKYIVDVMTDPKLRDLLSSNGRRLAAEDHTVERMRKELAQNLNHMNTEKKMISFGAGKIRRIWYLIKNPVYTVNYLKTKYSRPSEIINFKPRHIVFYITDECDLRCRWCLKNSAASKAIRHKVVEDLRLDAFKNILKMCPHAEYIGFTGQGEPLLNKDIFGMMEYATGKDLSIFLTTNGILLDDDKISLIMKYKVVYVNLSLKGKDRKEFSEVTLMDGRLFDKQIKNTRNLVAAKKKRKRNIILRISYVVDRNNFRNMEEVMRLAEDIGVDRLLFDNIVPFHDFKAGSGCLFEDDDEVREYIGRLKKAQGKVKVEFPVLLRRENFSYYCPGYYKFINIDAAGSISGCMRVLAPGPEYGNIFKDKDYMNTPHFRQMRKLYLTKELPDRCRFCVEMSRG